MGKDTLGAIIILACSTLITGILYHNYVKNEGDFEIIRGKLPNKEVSYRIEQNSHCIGSLKIVPVDEELFGLALRGVISVALDNQLTELKFKADQMFNPLGQLVKANFQLDGPNDSFFLTSSGVDKLDVSLQWFGAKLKSGDYRISLPGPVMLKRLGREGGFSLSLPWKVMPEYRKSYLNLLSSLGLALIESVPDDAKCEYPSLVGLQLTDIVSQFAQTHPQYKKLIWDLLTIGTGQNNNGATHE